MAIKYSIQYQDMVNVTHRFELHDDEYTGEEVEVQGTVVLEYVDVEDVLHAIKGSSIRVDLEANTSMTFNDLFAKDERSFLCYYFRDSQIKFKGWLNPEGWYEDFVNDNWMVSFDCVDGLGYLDALSYVDENGLTFSGIQSGLEVISNCLKRTGIKQNINIDVNFFYYNRNPLAENPIIVDKSIFDIINFNSTRFVRSDGRGDSIEGTIMSCYQVLKSILEVFTACITQKDGEWFIYRPNQIYLDTEINYYRYDYEGNEIHPLKSFAQLSKTIGSNIDDYYPHHCSENQSIRNKKALGAFRVNYKYGIIEGYLSSPLLCMTSDGFNPIWTVKIPDWNFVNPRSMNTFKFKDGNCGIEFNNLLWNQYVSDKIIALNLKTEKILISENEQVDIFIRYITTYRDDRACYFNYKILLSDKELPDNTASVMYIQDDFAWGSSDNLLSYNNWSGTQPNSSRPITIPVELNILTPPSPITTGFLYLEIWSPEGVVKSGSPYGITELKEVSIKPNVDGNGDIKGEFHTVERTENPASKVDKVKEVYTGDNLSDAYTGVIYQEDKETPTYVWGRKYGIFLEKKPICRIMAEDTLRMNAKTARIFSGDIYGFFDYLSVIKINGLKGVYLPIKYIYNTKENIISAEFKQMFGDELHDVEYELTYDYGNSVKPTIRG